MGYVDRSPSYLCTL